MFKLQTSQISKRPFSVTQAFLVRLIVACTTYRKNYCRKIDKTDHAHYKTSIILML